VFPANFEVYQHVFARGDRVIIFSLIRKKHENIKHNCLGRFIVLNRFSYANNSTNGSLNANADVNAFLDYFLSHTVCML